MSRPRQIEPLSEPPNGTVRIPGSKSITNRALVCASLATGSSVLLGALAADDTEAMIDCLSRLGASVTFDDSRTKMSIGGVAGRLRSGPIDLDARLSGTTARFVLPLLALGDGAYCLDGAEPLRARPMFDGIEVARALGSKVVEIGSAGHLPVRVTPGSLAEAHLKVRGSVSSQFLSGALMMGPCLPTGLTIELEGPLVSEPYVEMTTAVMRAFGAEVGSRSPGSYVVEPGGYTATTFGIEPDASAASYFFAAAAISGGRVRVSGLDSTSMQGDLGFVQILQEMGAEVLTGDSFVEVRGMGRLSGVDVDMADLSDTAQTLAVTAVFADGPTTITGIGFIRNKETDRIAATVTELRRCGVDAIETDDGLVVNPGTPHGALVRTYDDHRMAMSFSLIGLRVPGIEIEDPDCVAKTFPDYFDALDGLRRPGPGG